MQIYFTIGQMFLYYYNHIQKDKTDEEILGKYCYSNSLVQIASQCSCQLNPFFIWNNDDDDVDEMY